MSRTHSTAAILGLFLNACTTVNIEKSSSQFLMVDLLTCKKLTEIYNKASLVDLDLIDRNSTECGITYENFRLRKDTIRTFAPKFSVRTEFAVENPTVKSLIKVTKINVEHCQISSDKTSVEIDMTCGELENKLQ